MVAHEILVSALVPLVLGFEFRGLGVWGQGLTILDYVLLEYGGLPLVLLLAVHLEFLCWMGRGDHSKTVLLFVFCWERSPLGLKVMGWVVGGGGGGLQHFSVSPSPFWF